MYNQRTFGSEIKYSRC